ncbi:DNA/RNA nuclease SfsA [Candidatus Hodarchaeum mangrovi]
MKYKGNFYLASFKSRPNRFLAYVKLLTSFEGNKISQVVQAHVPDPGRLEELLIPQAKVILQEKINPKRKTNFSLIGVLHNKIWVNIDSQLTNELFQAEFHKIPRFKDYHISKPEFTFKKSRFDFLMENSIIDKKMLVEIKSVTLVKEGIALFPDAPTVRGKKHVKELVEALEIFDYAIIIFIVKRSDVYAFSPNKQIDPYFVKALQQAMDQNVEVLALKCHYDPIKTQEITIMNELEFINVE